LSLIPKNLSRGLKILITLKKITLDFNIQMTKKALKSAKILNIPVSSTSIDEVLDVVYSSLKSVSKFFITTPNPEIVVMAQSDTGLLEALQKADISVPDGIGLLWAAKYLGIKEPLVRIRGRELMVQLVEFAHDQKKKIFLLGSSNEVVKACSLKLKKEYPRLKFEADSGWRLDRDAYPTDKSQKILEKKAIEKINKFKPDILFVAFGAPKQEKWVSNHFKELNIGGAMVVGGSLDYYSGVAKLPPSWMASIGIEWLWRLIQDPKRFTRIWNAIFIFPLLVAKSRFKS